jgi:YtkA-like protein
MKFKCARGAFAATLWLLTALPALAQSDHQQTPAASAASPASCAQSVQDITRAIDALNAGIDEARQTNDAVKMRAAVGDLQVALAQIKTQLADCAALAQSSAAAGTMPEMDHSKAQMAPGMPVMQPGSTAPAAAAKPAAPMAGMDHSKMQMTTEGAAPAAGSTPSKAARKPRVIFTLRTQPEPPRSGKNDFEVTVKDADGKPISDAEVSLAFVRPAMPSMKTPEVKLTSTGNGTYKGSATMSMAGDWDVTIKASRNGQQLDVKRMRLTAK